MYECVALALTGQSSAKSQFVSARFSCFSKQPSERLPAEIATVALCVPLGLASGPET